MLMAARHSDIITNFNIVFFDNGREIPEAIKTEIQHKIKIFLIQMKETSPSLDCEKNWVFYVVNSYEPETHHLLYKQMEEVNKSQTNIVLLSKDSLQKEMVDYLSLRVNAIVSLSFLMNHHPVVLRSIVEKGIFLEPNFHRELILEIERKNSKDKPIKKLILNNEKVGTLLNEKEQNILQLILEGQSNKSIAEILFFAPSTIGTIISCLLKKINANDRTDAMVKAIRNGWVDALR